MPAHACPIRGSYQVAFAREALASDRWRATVMACLMGAVLSIYWSLFVFDPVVPESLWQGRLSLGLVVAFYAGAIAFVLGERLLLEWWERKGRPLPAPALYGCALVEVSLPTLVLIAHGNAVGPVLALVQPTSMLYFLVVFLSTLRLSFWLCVFSGAAAALQYVLLSTWMLNRADLTGQPEALVAPSVHYWRGGLYFMGGVLAGLIALRLKRQFRRAIEAALDRQRVVDVFGRHVSPQVVDRLLGQPLEQAGEVRHVCVMFLDIRDFTRLSSGLSPTAVVNYLNGLFDFMIECVNRHQGIVNKFLGDGFMAVFGAPVSDGRDCHNAVAASREILARLDELNARPGATPTRVGIGLHAGAAVAGNVGSAARKEYTIIGDTVNVASRIEGLNKQFGSRLLISEAVWKEAGGPADAENLGPVPVKGKADPIPVYRLA